MLYPHRPGESHAANSQPLPSDISTVRGISALAAIADATTHLAVALADYALQIGKPVDAIDYEHLKAAQRILTLLLEANRG
jgi:hypothetical protein